MTETYRSLVTPTVITVAFDGDERAPRSVFARDSARYARLLEALKREAPAEEVDALLDGRAWIHAWSCGEFEINGNKLVWTKEPGFEVHPALQKRLFEFANAGLDASAFAKFLSRLLQNPSRRSIETFYGFIEQQGLTIDREGYVIGYKGVSIDLKDMHTGSVDNSPGQHPKMDRRHVDDDPNQPCSTGSKWCPLAA